MSRSSSSRECSPLAVLLAELVGKAKDQIAGFSRQASSVGAAHRMLEFLSHRTALLEHGKEVGEKRTVLRRAHPPCSLGRTIAEFEPDPLDKLLTPRDDRGGERLPEDRLELGGCVASVLFVDVSDGERGVWKPVLD